MNIAVLQNVQAGGSRLVPSLRYRDVEAAIEWLSDTFGFQEHNVVSEPDGSLRHAQLTLGSDMIMLLPSSAGVAPPEGPRAESGGAETQSLYFVVDDAEAHYQRARAAGAEMLENGEYAFGGRGYSCRDPEGHVWHFGTFNPRQDEASVRSAWIREFLYGQHAQSVAGYLRDHLTPPAIVAAVVAAVVAAATVGWMLFALPQAGAGTRERGLAFKATLPSQPDEHGVRTLARPQFSAAMPDAQSTGAALAPEAADEPARDHTVAFAAIEAGQQTEQASERAALDAAERTTDEVIGKVHAARQAADRAGEEALKRARAARMATAAPPAADALRPAATSLPDSRQQPLAREQALKDVVAKEVATKVTAAREAAAKEAAEKAAAAKDAAVRDAAAREVAAKDAAKKKLAERAAKEARNWAPETERVKPEPQLQGKAQGENAVAKPKAFAAEVAPESPRGQSQSASPSQSQEQASSGQFWDCRPTPPDGQVVCHPIRGR